MFNVFNLIADGSNADAHEGTNKIEEAIWEVG